MLYVHVAMKLVIVIIHSVIVLLRTKKNPKKTLPTDYDDMNMHDILVKISDGDLSNLPMHMKINVLFSVCPICSDIWVTDWTTELQPEALFADFFPV
jgi:hypothetical protein